MQVPHAPCSHDVGTKTPFSRSTSTMVLPPGTRSVIAERASATSNADDESIVRAFLKYSKCTLSSGQPAFSAMERTASSIGAGPQT